MSLLAGCTTSCKARPDFSSLPDSVSLLALHVISSVLSGVLCEYEGSFQSKRKQLASPFPEEAC